MLEFSGQAESNDKLEYESLQCHDRDHAQQCLGENPSFKEEHDLPECKKGDDGNGMSDSSKDGAELLAAHAQHRTHTARHAKETSQDTSIDSNGSKGHNCHTDE